VVELSRWAVAQLNRGTLDGVRILSPQAYDLMWRPRIVTGNRYWPEIGLAWFLGERSGHRCAGHEGEDVGFKSCLILVPEKQVSVVGLSNRDRMKIEALVDAILDEVLISTSAE
jgi:CubicO group peptidase (beta-lactamase class C family)